MEAVKTFNFLINTAVSVEHLEFVGLHGPDVDVYVSADGWTTAELHIQVSEDGTTWRELLTAAAAYVGVASFVSGKVFKIEGVPRFRHLRFASQASNGTPTNQAAARVLTVTIESYP